jgi:hypothetical protein
MQEALVLERKGELALRKIEFIIMSTAKSARLWSVFEASGHPSAVG